MDHSTANPSNPPLMRPHRITFCITELDPGGAERQFASLVRGIAQKHDEFEADVVCLSGRGALVDVIEELNISVTCLQARGRFDVGTVARLSRHLRQRQPDLIQTFLFHANIAGRIAARCAGVKHVVSGIRVAERRSRWRLVLDRWTDRFVDRHVCVSQAVADFSTRNGGLPATKLVVIPNGIDAGKYANATPADLGEFGWPADTQLVLFAGRLDEQKDPLLLLSAFGHIADRFPQARLLFVGRGPLRERLENEARTFGGRVKFAGFRNDVPSLLKAAACLALPSRWEGMPNVALESMAAGTPLIASPAEGIPELLGGGPYGTVISDRTATAWGSALADRLRSAHGGPGKWGLSQHSFPERFMSDQMIESYAALYRELLIDPKAERSGVAKSADGSLRGKI